MLLPIVHYINYFEDDIKEKKLTKEFDELQKVTFELEYLTAETLDESDYIKKYDCFEQFLNGVVSACENTK